MAERTDYEMFPCGCETWFEGKTMIFHACAEACSIYRYTLKVAMQQRKPLTKVYADPAPEDP